MDQAAFEDKIFLGNIRKCSPNPNLLCIIAYCLVGITGYDLKIDRSTYEILQVLGLSLLDKTPVKELFTNIDYKDVKELNYNQLEISFI